MFVLKEKVKMDINELKIKELDSLKMRESIISFPNQIDEMLEKGRFYSNTFSLKIPEFLQIKKFSYSN